MDFRQGNDRQVAVSPRRNFSRGRAGVQAGRGPLYHRSGRDPKSVSKSARVAFYVLEITLFL